MQVGSATTAKPEGIDKLGRDGKVLDLEVGVGEHDGQLIEPLLYTSILPLPLMAILD